MKKMGSGGSEVGSVGEGGRKTTRLLIVDLFKKELENLDTDSHHLQQPAPL